MISKCFCNYLVFARISANFEYLIFHFCLAILISQVTSGTHAQAHTTRTVRGDLAREKDAKVGGGKAGRGG